MTSQRFRCLRTHYYHSQSSEFTKRSDCTSLVDRVLVLLSFKGQFHSYRTMSEAEPTPTPSSTQHSTKSYFSYPVSHVVSGLYRRLTEPDRVPNVKAPPAPSLDMHNGVYTPPQRTASPFQPPPLTPLTLKSGSASSSSIILTRALAEEIRLLFPPRLQLAESWSLAYSLEEDGVSLTTLYSKCASSSIPKSSSFILVIKDAAGGVSPSPQPLALPLPSNTKQHPATRFSAPI